MNDLEEIEKIEKKYFLEILEVLTKNKKELVERFNSHLEIKRETQRISYKKNLVDAGTERVLMSILCREKPNWDINSSPISADLLFELPDALINIDAKTYKNKQKEENKVNLRKNQTSYGDSIYFTSKRTDTKLTWMPALRTTYNHNKYGEIPCLTYVVKFIYSNNEQRLLEVQLINIPNGQLISIYGENILGRGKSSLDVGKPVSDIRFVISKFSNPKLTSGWNRKEIIYKKDHS